MKTSTLYIGTQPDPGDRLKIEISREDYERIPPRGSRSQRAVTVTDQATGRKYIVRRASCDIPGCRCAIELVLSVIMDRKQKGDAQCR